VGAIRLSRAFRDELTEPVKRKYHNRSKAKAKNIGEIEVYS
jgi:hypothetical protein